MLAKKKIKAQQSLPVPQRQPRKKWPRKMHEGRSHTPTVFAILEKSTSKERKLFSTEILWNHQHCWPSSLNRASGFILLKAHESHYVQSHTFKAPIQNPHAFITIHTVDQDKQMRLLTRGSIFFARHTQPLHQQRIKSITCPAEEDKSGHLCRQSLHSIPQLHLSNTISSHFLLFHQLPL